MSCVPTRRPRLLVFVRRLGADKPFKLIEARDFVYEGEWPKGWKTAMIGMVDRLNEELEAEGSRIIRPNYGVYMLRKGEGPRFAFQRRPIVIHWYEHARLLRSRGHTDAAIGRLLGVSRQMVKRHMDKNA